MSEPIAKAIQLCTLAFQDLQGRWSLISIFNFVKLGPVPSQLPSFSVFSTIADIGERGSYVVQIEDPKGLVIWSNGQQMFEANSKDADFVISVPAMTVFTYGAYRIALYVNGDRLCDAELKVLSINEPIVA